MTVIVRPSDIGGVPENMKRMLIANAIDKVIRQLFPDRYAALCHLYAVVGAIVLSECCRDQFVPVAGIAAIPTGDGLLKMTDEWGFFRREGGAYHCWIESVDTAEKVLVDFSFRNNEEYAQASGIRWDRPRQEFIWGASQEVNVAESKQDKGLPESLPLDKVWFQKTESGVNWIAYQLSENGAEFAKVSSFVLYQIRKDLIECLALNQQ